jgi:cytoskeletal protein CcmA (bactofilin family)
MFNRNPNQAPPDAQQTPVAGMREMAPAAPAPTTPPPAPAQMPAPARDESVVAPEDELEGTVKSRGTVRVLGRMKGRVEAVRVHIEDGAAVEADIVVDEAIIAGSYVGTLTCRQRLEVRASGRLSGRVETFRVMLHEGASVEGEMHMLKGPGEVDNVRGKAPVRGTSPAPSTGGSAHAATGAKGNGSGAPPGNAPGTSIAPRASVPVEPDGQAVD